MIGGMCPETIFKFTDMFFGIFLFLGYYSILNVKSNGLMRLITTKYSLSKNTCLEFYENQKKYPEIIRFLIKSHFNIIRCIFFCFISAEILLLL